MFIGERSISAGDIGDISLVDGRKITATLTMYTEMSKPSSVKMPFVKAVMSFTYEGRAYELYSMTGSDGKATFISPTTWIS